ncbi:mitochondrial outer membrane protein porin 6 [Typha latifolia]|uniref:mitochondrial outer membrane protein porin 6 n=1 Tax=Typha latifolia TaxID=4733 RepID=UPI003C2BC6AA
MSNGPAPFFEIGKKAKDLLNKDYSFDHKFSLTTLSDAGLGLTATGVKIDQLFIGDISTQYRSGRTTVNVKVDTNSHVSTTITVNEIVTGLKTSFSFKIPDQKSGKLDLQYLHDRTAINSSIDMTPSPLLELAATIGTKELSLGAEVGFDSASASFAKYNAGIGYNKPDLSAALILADKGETLKASYVHLVNPKNGAAVAAEVTHRFSTNENNFTIGSFYALDPLTTVKTRFSNTGKVAALCQHQWRPKSFVTLSAEYDPKAATAHPRVGLAVALKP